MAMVSAPAWPRRLPCRAVTVLVVGVRSGLVVAAAALATAAVVGCNGEPAAPSIPAAATGASDASAAQAAPSAALAGERSASFDVGEIKTAAEYLADPEFANADLRQGERLAFACIACHTLADGQPHNIGPNLHGVFGRRAAALPDFAYSPALSQSGLVWTPRALAAWLDNPARFVEGTTMAFTGYRDAEDRRDLIAYLLRETR
jgi:cytochrome c